MVILQQLKEIELTQESIMNKLFCTFSAKDSLEYTISSITGQYTILYEKIFVLSSPDSNEYLCTYNIEVDGPTTKILPNTILLHRKKESNTLYTINALNTLIKQLNEGILDTKFPINWQDYRNCVLLTQSEGLKRINTAIHKIVNI
jgi:hypothetical protein